MCGGRVALVLCVAVLGIEFVEFKHHFVPLDLGDYACGHYLRVLSVGLRLTAALTGNLRAARSVGDGRNHAVKTALVEADILRAEPVGEL